MNFTLREVTPADVPIIVRQRHAMFVAQGYVNRAELDLTDEKFEEWIEGKIESGEYRGWFLFDERDQLAAGAGLWVVDWVPHAIDRETKRGNILNLYADPQYHDVDLKRQLLTQILDYCRENGIRTVTANPGDALRPLYDALGFRPTHDVRLQLSVPN